MSDDVRPLRWALLFSPLLLLACTLLTFFVVHAGHESVALSAAGIYVKGAAVAVCLALGFLSIRIIDLLVWHRKAGVDGDAIPVMVRQLVALVVWLVALCTIIAVVFGQSITAILTASTVAIGVVGFALQRPIMDAFAGVVIAIQRPFKEGDWVQTDDKGSIGRIVEMNWRSVRLVTTDDITFFLPNSQLTNFSVKVYSLPEPFFRDEIRITLPFGVTTHQGQRLLLGAANQVEEVAAIPRDSLVSIAEYSESGVLWRLLYWCPDPARLMPTRFKVHQNILRNLHYAGIQIPAPRRQLEYLDESHPPPAERDIDQLIARAALFAGLNTEELRYLSQHCKSRIFDAGSSVLRQGEPGDSLFILRDGLLAVKVRQPNEQEIEVAKISPGQFFGERSLLLGEPRTATISAVVDSSVTEISKHVLAKLLRERPEIANYMSEVLGERESANSSKFELSHAYEGDAQIPRANKLFQKITAFFNLAA